MQKSKLRVQLIIESVRGFARRSLKYFTFIEDFCRMPLLGGTSTLIAMTVRTLAKKLKNNKLGVCNWVGVWVGRLGRGGTGG